VLFAQAGVHVLPSTAGNPHPLDASEAAMKGQAALNLRNRSPGSFELVSIVAAYDGQLRGCKLIA